MKQITQNYKSGAIRLADVEWPALKAGGVLVRSRYSVISSGTEGMKVREGKLSYVGKARARPDQLKKVFDTVRQQGVVAAYQKVMNKLDSLTPLGYSLAGEVMAIGAEAEEFYVGQRVACAGAGYANHAEINFVPKNLVVPIPDNVSLKHGAFATIGAIALQGFRQSDLKLGETACVIGLGLLGQLLMQILRAAGVQVVGVDLLENRCRLAQQFGANFASTPDDPALDSRVTRLTNGHGVDCVFITTGGSSNTATELAARVARDRARVVDIGKTKLDLPWNDYYLKELEVRFSRSYGPGRYDPVYEEKGIDYPIGYVRWTERRNLATFLDLVGDGKISLDPIISATYPLSEAERAYQDIITPGRDFLGIVIDYGQGQEVPVRPARPRPVAVQRAAIGRLRLGVVGAGNYASSMLLPHLVRNDHIHLARVATATSLSAQNAQRKFGFQSVTTDYREVIEATDIDAVIVATRHASHAPLVAAALRAGKAVYVEKPLAITLEGVEEVRQAVQESNNDRLMIGFNRRFAPLIRKLSERMGGRRTALVSHYRVHAGRLSEGSWYLDPAEGSRFVGEAGHFFDVMAYIADSRPVSVTAMALRPAKVTCDDLENMSVAVRYENGSVGNLLYLTQGGSKLPKEVIEVFGGGVTSQLHNFESLTFYDGSSRKRMRDMRVDKGQRGELEAFADAVRAGRPMPIPIDSLFDTTLTTLAAVEATQTGEHVILASYSR